MKIGDIVTFLGRDLRAQLTSIETCGEDGFDMYYFKEVDDGALDGFYSNSEGRIGFASKPPCKIVGHEKL